MPTIKDPGPTTVEGHISYADVLFAVPVDAATGEIQPGATNAAAIRDKLGRGSLGTIQKHLEAIRAELAAAQIPPSSVVPEAPADLTAALWSAAWSSAQAHTLNRHDKLVIERDALRVRVSDLGADLAALTDDADRLRSELDVAKRDAEISVAAAASAAAEQASEASQAAASASAEISRLASELRDAQHQAQLDKRDFEIERKSLNTQIERLESRVAELLAAQIHAAQLQAELKASKSESK